MGHFISLWSLQQAKEPKLVPKRERLLKGSEDLILSLYAKGMDGHPIKM